MKNSYTKDIKTVKIGGGDVREVVLGKSMPLAFILGPCAIESEDHSMFMAEKISKICEKYSINWVFKSCYDKDCRSSVNSFHGLGLEGLEILNKVRTEFEVPVVSDFSDSSWGKATGEVCDLVQIPAYLCRQTTMLKAAAETKKPLHLKKGQFMSPWNMKNSVRKLENFGTDQIILADRGTTFGYNMLVNDMTCLPIMNATGYPVCFDATHSVQLPTSMGNISGGQREFIPYLVRGAIAVGVQVIFMEVHDNPSEALSDANTVLDLKHLETVLQQALIVHQTRLEILDKFGDDEVHLDD
jgi:2-dehydro-3-deoxyphosphooctonate aldolase (KDO 8-P synthase)